MATQALAEQKMVEVTVDGKNISVPADFTVLQACESTGVRIPRFCYHDRLSVAGNCRMCLVELEKAPKPVASCAMPLMPGMNIKTNTPLVHKAREGVIEFLLANHPLDCPICDAGGECDLQDQAMKYGSDRGRYRETKRAVEDKNIGPLVKTIMTRCIHCTRCVRFAEEISGVEDLGITGRGNQVEVGTYVEKPYDSELSGNIIDLCPVGALTSKPFSFTARPWELQHTETVDCNDAVGANIRVDHRGTSIMRVLPRIHEDINEEWIDDKKRFSYDGLTKQRIDVPAVKDTTEGIKFHRLEWADALDVAANAIKNVQPYEIRGIAGDMVDAEGLLCFKELLNRLGCDNVECRQDGSRAPADFRSQYLFNSTIAGIEEADTLLMIGTNPRMEAPLINARIRKAWMHNGLNVSYIGPAYETLCDAKHLGTDLAALSSDAVMSVFEGAERPMVVVGQSVLNRSEEDAEYVYRFLNRVASKVPLVTEDWNGVNVLQTAAARGAALDLGLVPGAHSTPNVNPKVVILLGADEVDESTISKDAFVIYVGHHGDRGAHRANLILPSLAWTEKSGVYVNTEGRVQESFKVVGGPGQAKDDWKIMRALSEVLGVSLPYNTLDDVRSRLMDVAPHFATVDAIERSSLPFSQVDKTDSSVGTCSSTPLVPYYDNFWFTNPVSRSSKVMGRAAIQLPNATNNYQ